MEVIWNKGRESYKTKSISPLPLALVDRKSIAPLPRALARGQRKKKRVGFSRNNKKGLAKANESFLFYPRAKAHGNCNCLLRQFYLVGRRRRGRFGVIRKLGNEMCIFGS